MRKDIKPPKAEKISIAIVTEQDTFGNMVWNVYILNENDFTVESVIINSFGEGEIDGQKKKTSTLRHVIPSLEAQTVAKVEPIQEELFVLDNTFQITYFAHNKLYDMNITFKANTINAGTIMYISEVDKMGMIKP